MKEIGGYFELDRLISDNGEYYKDLVSLNTARNALVYLVKAKKINKIYIPYLLCDSVSLVCDRERIEYEYYHTDENFQPIFDRELKDNEYLYVVNLYGQLSNERISELKRQYKRIIADNIHAFFQKPIDGIDTIYSCRKFFGVPDGAYLATDCLLDVDLPIDNSEGRVSHIYGRVKDGATAHYAEFQANDASFEQLSLMRMSELTHNMLSRIDYNQIREIREKNYSYLHEQLGGMNRLNFRIPEGPYAYPFYCENGMAVKKRLAEKKIYVATLWPNVLELGETIERDYAENILPLPCDQRYEIEDMQFMASILYKIVTDLR